MTQTRAIVLCSKTPDRYTRAHFARTIQQMLLDRREDIPLRTEQRIAIARMLAEEIADLPSYQLKAYLNLV